MSRKKTILAALENHVDKIILGVMVFISLVLLWKYVISNPYGAKVRIGGRQTSVNPGNIDRKLKADADKLLQGLDQPPKSDDYRVYDKTAVADYTRKMQSAIAQVPSDLSIPYPGVGEAVREEDRLYVVPQIPSLSDVRVAVVRGAAQIPAEEVTPGMPYNAVQTKVEDMDFVTVSARFDIERLYNNFQLSFTAPGLKWPDSQLAKPVLARLELQRRVKLDDGSFSEWSTVPRAETDAYKKLFEQLPFHADQMQFGVDVWISQFESQDVQMDILQPPAYEFAVSRVEWMPPEFLQETYDIMQKEVEQERREAIEERRKMREAEQRATRSTGGNERRSIRRPVQTRPGAGLRDTETMDEAQRRQTRRPERTRQDVQRDMRRAMLRQNVRLESIREPVLVWVHDDTVQPGQTYQYRIRMGVFNPITGKDWFYEDQLAFKDQTVLWSDYSAAADDVKIPKMLHVFPMDPLTVTREDGSREIQGVKVEVAKYSMGRWKSHEFDVYPGQPIGYPVKEEQEDGMQPTDGLGVVNPRFIDRMGAGMGIQNTEPEKVDYTSGMTMVDVVEEVNWGLQLRRSDFYNMLYYDADTLEQMGIGKSNWPAQVKEAYNDVQDAMAESVEFRNRTIDGMRMMPGRREEEERHLGL